jgi:hypothetical protein
MSLLAAPLLAALLHAQAPAPLPYSARAQVPVDPYTQGDRAAMKKAGYESFGPFPFGTGHTSADVVALLGTEPLIWIETEHFRIGCALSPLALKNDEPWRDDWVTRLRQELKRLAARLPRVKTDVKELDPWLRAHLVAQRAEELYADVLANFGIKEFSFPTAPDDPDNPEEFRGLGRHLGMREKFTILLLRKSASHARYTRAYQGHEMADPIRYHDGAFGCLYWGGSEETSNGLFAQDYPLQAHMTFNLASNLYSGYRSYSHELPTWLVTGLAHWHARRVTPRFPSYDRKDDNDKDPRSAFWEWNLRVRGLLKNGAFEPVGTLLDRTNSGAFGIEQHIQSWALVDFLMSEQKTAAMQFVHALKEPMFGRRRVPTELELRERQLDCLKTCLGWTPEQFEEAWRGSVLGRAKK